MNTHTFKALGTHWWVEIFDEVSPETIKAAFGNLEQVTREFEARYSRFKSDSLISKLNHDRKLENPDEAFRTLLAYGKQLYLRSNTHFNLLTGHIQERRGYNAGYTFESQRPELLREGNPVTDLLISRESTKLLHGNVDIGGYGKGYLIDKLVTLLKTKFALHFFLINGGGDIYASSKHENPITIYLEHPTEPKKLLARPLS